MRHSTITRETKASRYFVIDEANYTSKTDRPSYTKYLLLTYKEKLNIHPKAFTSDLNHHAAEATAIHKCTEIIHSEFHLANTCDSPSIDIKIPIKGHHPTLGLELSTSDIGRIIIDNMSIRTSACRTSR